MFCVLDGIDECESRSLILDRLLKVACGHVKVLVTSRHIRNIEWHLSETPQVAMDEHAIKLDIDSYITACFKNDPKLSRINSAVKSKIKDDLVALSNGMYVYRLSLLMV